MSSRAAFPFAIKKDARILATAAPSATRRNIERLISLARARKGKSAPAAGGTGAAASAAGTARTNEADRAAHRETERARSGRPDAVSRWLDAAQQDDVRAFIAARLTQMDQRKYQMSLIKDFVADPSRFGLSAGDIPTSTSPEEFAERRGELEYRIATVKTFLDLLTEELRQLDLAEAYARRGKQPQKPRLRSTKASGPRRSA